jgi:hypothetical protein
MAEEAVYAALKKGLPKGWYAWHSLRVRTADGLLGEGDFVIVDPQNGMLVLEVKGGQIEQRDGRWWQNGRLMEVAPLDQALRFQKRLVQRLQDCGCRPPAFGSAVIFPDMLFDVGPGQDDLSRVTLGKRDLAWIEEALPKVMESALPGPAGSRGPWLDKLHGLWGETWIPRLSLGTRTNDVEERRYRLDATQVAVLEGLLENERVLLQGAAGSGKTLLAAEAAVRHHAEGHRVLLLCFTRTLATWLHSRVARPGIDVMTVSALATSLLEERGENVDFANEPEAWEAMKLRAAENLPADRWDCVVVDEAQDLTEAEWIIVAGLAEGKGKHLWALYDEGQRFWPERVLPTAQFSTVYRLPKGYRCPSGIQSLANRYVGAAPCDEAIMSALRDGSLRIVECREPKKVGAGVAAEVARLRAEGVEAHDIAVISLRGQASPDAIFYSEGIGAHRFVRADAKDMDENLVADSFLRWKGLERPAVVITDLPSDEVRQRSVRMYVALTRALVAVSIVATREQMEKDPVLAALL